MDRLRLFSTQAGYEDEEANLRYPTVSYIEGTKEVMFIPEEVKYKQKYLTTEALESGAISFNIWHTMGTDMITSISYSTDNGQTWTTTQNVNNKSDHIQISVNVEEGDKVLWKGIATQTGYYDVDDYDDVVGSFFSSDCEYNAYGNVMSLLHGDDFYGETSLGNTEYTFGCLFSDHNWVESCQIVSAQNLILPTTTLATGCYSEMFQGCTSLATAPELPATTLTNSCYSEMFNGCTALTTSPELPATTLADSCYSEMFNGCTALTTAPATLPATTLASNCYYSMFRGCTSLTTAPVLPATTLADGCYTSMFYGCTSLTTASELPATTLVDYCYSRMFYGCTSLTTAPVLPATTMVQYCYQGMFQGCTSLTTAPELPATTLTDSCYRSMFQDCTSLITAPVLPATTLVSDCYRSMFSGCTSLITAPELPAAILVRDCYQMMFKGCTNLNYIKAMFTTTPSNVYTASWVSGVASTGTFIKNSAATWTRTDVDGIPTGWTVQTASE